MGRVGGLKEKINIFNVQVEGFELCEGLKEKNNVLNVLVEGYRSVWGVEEKE